MSAPGSFRPLRDRTPPSDGGGASADGRRPPRRRHVQPRRCGPVEMGAACRAGALVAIAALVLASAAHAASADAIDRDAGAALKRLYAQSSAAQVVGKKAKGVLVFPRILKAGFMVGAQSGDGALRQGQQTTGYYRSVAASYGFQAGIQSFGYALFFMSDSALAYLRASDGWEIGTGPSVVVVDQGMARNLTTTTLKRDVYAFVFGQKGLMAGVGIQGSKITKINPG
jgi:lipid-binding SYLF domain-containing protein